MQQKRIKSDECLCEDKCVRVTPRPDRFTPGKETRYPLYRRLGGPQGRSGRVRKISPPPGFVSRTIAPTGSLYTDNSVPATSGVSVRCNISSVDYLVTHTHMHTQAYAHKYIYIYMCVCVCMCVNIHTHAHTLIRTHIYVCVCLYVHIQEVAVKTLCMCRNLVNYTTHY
jgi:hypothetical protein